MVLLARAAVQAREALVKAVLVKGGAGQGSGIGQNGHSNQVGEPNRLG